MLTYIALIAGLVLLVFAGDLLVRGAVGLAERLEIPALIIGLTIVAFGTSAPELVIALRAASSGSGDIAVGNVVGSNIANVFLVLGAPAIIAAVACHGRGTRRNMVFMVAMTLVFIALSFDREISRFDGVVMLGLLALFLYENYRSARRHRKEAQSALDDEFGDIGQKSPALLGAFLAGGLIGLPVAASLTIFGAAGVARAWGVSEGVIGLTVVAIGTSLPELVAALMAAWHRQSAVAIGNVIGSNIFNILAIMGTTSVIFPLGVSDEIFSPGMWLMLAAALVPLPFVFLAKPINRWIGLTMLALYVAYVVMALGAFGAVA